jgi:SAM-dependent methyltransferase
MGSRMPTLAQNRRTWAVEYDWSRSGEEWSDAWGNSEAQWFHVIYPRIHRLVPAPTILEVGVGFGRWTQYLLPLCERLIGIDIAPLCVNACKERFPRGQFYVNDGKTLGMVRDGEIDFIFSFDSLVHADDAVMRSYIHEFQRILSRNGCGFIHHSNICAYRTLLESGEMKNPHWRDPTVSADVFQAFCKEASVACAGQELVSWGSEHLIDCFSLIAKRGGLYDKPYVRVENPNFMTEADRASLTQPLYEPSVNTQKT